MKKNGFTFVELLVTITIISVIFAAGITSYTSISRNSRDARRASDMEAIRQALEMCRSIDGEYPTTIYDNITCPTSTSVVTLKETPLDPRSCASHADGEYSYALTADGYLLTADCMEDSTRDKDVTNP